METVLKTQEGVQLGKIIGTLLGRSVCCLPDAESLKSCRVLVILESPQIMWRSATFLACQFGRLNEAS